MMPSIQTPGNNKVLGCKDVPASDFIRSAAELLKSYGKFEIPKSFEYIKSGVSRELAPQENDFIYVRAASILRKVAFNNNIGVGLLKRVYGKSQNNGFAPHHHRDASGKIIRHCLQQLTKLGLVELSASGKRRLTSKGQAVVDQIARKH